MGTVDEVVQALTKLQGNKVEDSEDLELEATQPAASWVLSIYKLLNFVQLGRCIFAGAAQTCSWGSRDFHEMGW